MKLKSLTQEICARLQVFSFNVSTLPNHYTIYINCTESVNNNKTWLKKIELRLYASYGQYVCNFVDPEKRKKYQIFHKIVGSDREKLIDSVVTYISDEYEQIKVNLTKMDYVKLIVKPFENIDELHVINQNHSNSVSIQHTLHGDGEEGFVTVFYKEDKEGDYIEVRHKYIDRLSRKILVSDPDADKQSQEAILEILKISIMRYIIVDTIDRSRPVPEAYYKLVEESKPLLKYKEIQSKCLDRIRSTGA